MVILFLWWLEVQSQMREEEQPLSDRLMELEGVGQALVTGVLGWDSVTGLKLSTAERDMAIQSLLSPY